MSDPTSSVPLDWRVAVETLADNLPDAAFDMGSSLSCVEADAVARVIALVSENAAASFLLGHADSESEEEGDSHFDYGITPAIYASGLHIQARALALQYVREEL